MRSKTITTSIYLIDKLLRGFKENRSRKLPHLLPPSGLPLPSARLRACLARRRALRLELASAQTREREEEVVRVRVERRGDI